MDVKKLATKVIEISEPDEVVEMLRDVPLRVGKTEARIQGHELVDMDGTVLLVPEDMHNISRSRETRKTKDEAKDEAETKTKAKAESTREKQKLS